MGNVEVKYKPGRGSHKSDAIVENSKDYVEQVLGDQYEHYQSIYNAQTDEVKEAITQIFDGESVFDDKAFAECWLVEQDDDAAFEGVHQKLLEIIASIASQN